MHNGSMLHSPQTNYHLLTAKQEPYQKAHLLSKNTEEFSGKVRRMGQQAGTRQDRKSNVSRQKNKTGDSKVKSNDSPENQDRVETSDIPGLPSGFMSLMSGILSANMSGLLSANIVGLLSANMSGLFSAMSRLLSANMSGLLTANMLGTFSYVKITFS